MAFGRSRIVQEIKMDEKKTLTVEEAARELGVSRNKAYEACHNGEIPVIRIGRRMLIPRVAFERMLSGEAA